MAFTDKPQFKNGKHIENMLDRMFTRKGWTITILSQHDERVKCIGDRKFEKGELVFNIEYKSGVQTFFTGNVFLETVSVDTEQKPGWVYTSRADFIFYAAILNERILVFTPDRLREQIEELKLKFHEVPTSKRQNDGYNTHGVIVPLDYAERNIAAKVIMIDLVDRDDE